MLPAPTHAFFLGNVGIALLGLVAPEGLVVRDDLGDLQSDVRGGTMSISVVTRCRLVWFALLYDTPCL